MSRTTGKRGRTENEAVSGGGKGGSVPTLVWRRIPPEILGKLNRHKAALSRQGVLQLRSGSKRKVSWRLRFREYDSNGRGYRHRSITIGSDIDVANAVQELLYDWQAETKRVRQEAADKKRAERCEKKQKAAMKKAHLVDLLAIHNVNGDSPRFLMRPMAGTLCSPILSLKHRYC